MPATERDEVPPREVSAVPMRDLLASCAAAHAVSTPPRVPDPETARPLTEHPAAHRKTGHREAA